MANKKYIKSITQIDGSTFYLKDSRIDDATSKNQVLVSSTDSYKWVNNPIIPAVSDVSGTAYSNNPSTAAIWRVNLPDVSLYSGLTIQYKVPSVGGAAAAFGVLLRIDGTSSSASGNDPGDTSLNLYPVCTGTITSIATRYPANNIVTLVFDANQAGQYFKYKSNTTVTTSANGSGWTKKGCWKVTNDYVDGNDKTVAYNLYYTYDRPKVGAKALYRYKFVAQDKDNRIIPLTLENSSTSMNKSINTTPFQPDRIYYYNSGSTVNANGAVTASTLYASMAVTTNVLYTFNENLTTYSRVYLCGDFNKKTGLFTLQNSKLIMTIPDSSKNASTAFTAIVPTGTANVSLGKYFSTGKYYIFLGETYSTANYFHLEINHPMYYFDGTDLVPFAYTISDKIKVDGNIATTDENGYVNITTGATDEKQKVTSTTSTYYISGVSSAPAGTAVEGVANSNAQIQGGNKLVIPNASIATTTVSSGLTAANMTVSGTATISSAQITTLNGVTVGSSPKFTDNNTTYSFSSGSTNGAFSVTPSGGSATTVYIKGLDSAAYCASNSFATAGHSLSLSSASGSGTTAITSLTVSGHTIGIATASFLTSHQTVTNGNPTLAWGSTSTVGTVGATALTVKMPSNPNTDTKQQITASTAKVYLTGVSATSTTSVGYANASVFMESGNIIDAGGAVRVANVDNTAGGNMIYDATEKCIKFTFS